MHATPLRLTEPEIRWVDPEDLDKALSRLRDWFANEIGKYPDYWTRITVAAVGIFDETREYKTGFSWELWPGEDDLFDLAWIKGAYGGVWYDHASNAGRWTVHTPTDTEVPEATVKDIQYLSREAAKTIDAFINQQRLERLS